MLKKLNCVKMLNFIDIGANLTDPMFRGVYGGKQKHPDDFDAVMARAWQNDVQKMIITVGTLSDADEALKIANQDERLYITMGCHPTRCDEFLQQPQYYEGLRAKIIANPEKVIAIGECGLDYCRLHFCPKETQGTYFEKQLDLAAEFRLPFFLHCRDAFEPFFEILDRNRDKLLAGGVVHSFDGSWEEAKKVLSYANFYIGLNGCSLKTAENLAVVKQIPNDRIMLETDAPWCGVRPTHAGHKYVKSTFPTVKKPEKWSAETMVNSRNEPCQIRQVLEIIAGVKEENPKELAEIFYKNTLALFFNNKNV